MIVKDTSNEIVYLQRLKAGDERAFIYFYNTYKLPIYRKLLQLVHLDNMAEEFTQDVFVKLWIKRALIDPEQCFKAYLFRMTKNVLYDFYRKVARDARLQQEIRTFTHQESCNADEGLLLKETQHILNQALDSLSAQQRLIYQLCKLEGKSYQEVALQLGISIHTISTHMTRASKKVKDHMLKHKHLLLLWGICATLFK